MFNWSYRKVGGLRFVRIGRFGFSFWISRVEAKCAVVYYPQRRYEGGRSMVANANSRD